MKIRYNSKLRACLKEVILMNLNWNVFKKPVIFLILFLFVGSPSFGWYDIEEPPPMVKTPPKKTEVAPVKSEQINQTQTITQTGVLYGKVVAGELPLSGAVVTLSNGMTAVTDAQGEYTISNIPQGQYTVKMSMKGYNTATGNIIVEPGKTRRVLSSLSPDYMPPRNLQLRGDELTKQTQSVTRKSNKPKEEKKEYGYITVKAYPQKDLTGGFRDNGKVWWVYSIRVEQISGNLRWSDTYNRPTDYSSRAKELYCRDALVGEEYRIEIEWRDLRSRDSRTRRWTKKMDSFDKKFTFDAPSY